MEWTDVVKQAIQNAQNHEDTRWRAVITPLENLGRAYDETHPPARVQRLRVYAKDLARAIVNIEIQNQARPFVVPPPPIMVQMKGIVTMVSRELNKQSEE